LCLRNRNCLELLAKTETLNGHRFASVLLGSGSDRSVDKEVDKGNLEFLYSFKSFFCIPDNIGMLKKFNRRVFIVLKISFD